MIQTTTCEQQARDMLERLGWAEGQNLSSGEIVELANLIAAATRTPLELAAGKLLKACQIGLEYVKAAEGTMPVPNIVSVDVERIQAAIAQATEENPQAAG